MIISDAARLWLYVIMGIGPIWQQFFIESVDYSFRGLMMPIVSTIVTAAAVILAKTSTKKGTPEEPSLVEVTNTPANPLPVTETAPTPDATPVVPSSLHRAPLPPPPAPPAPPPPSKP